MTPRGRSDVRPETKALAAARARAASAFTAGSPLSGDEQVMLLKGLCRFLWRVLDRRMGADGLPTTDELWDDLSEDGRAAVDRCYDAAEILMVRDRIHVEPCRRPLHAQWCGTPFFLAIYPNGEKRNVSEDELLAMAGLVQ